MNINWLTALWTKGRVGFSSFTTATDSFGAPEGLPGSDLQLTRDVLVVVFRLRKQFLFL